MTTIGSFEGHIEKVTFFIGTFKGTLQTHLFQECILRHPIWLAIKDVFRIIYDGTHNMATAIDLMIRNLR